MKKTVTKKLVIQRLTLVQLEATVGGSLGGGKSVTKLMGDSAGGGKSVTVG